MYENDQKFQQWAQSEGYTQNANGTWNENPYHNYLIGVNQLYPEDFQPVKGEAQSVKKVNGRTIYNPLYDNAKKKRKSAAATAAEQVTSTGFGTGNFASGTDWQSYDRQEAINKQHESEDAAYAKEQGWDKTTPGSVTQGEKKNWLDRTIDKIAGRIAAKKEDPNNLANVNYGDGNIDLNSRPAVQNPDGSYSTVDSITIEEDGTYVNIPTVVWLDGEWQHVDENTAKEYYKQTGQYLGRYSTLDEAVSKAKQLSQDQAALYGLDKQSQPMTMPSYDPDAAKQRQKDQQYLLWKALHPNMTLEDYYRIFPNRAPK